MGWWRVLGAVALALASEATLAGAASPSDDCTAVAGARTLCGPSKVEDLVDLPGTRWLIGSGMNGPHGDLYLIDKNGIGYRSIGATRDYRVSPRPEGPCMAPPARESIVTHGLGILPLGEKRFRLLAINHGGREAIEIFDIDARNASPLFTWVGCREPKLGLPMNAVAAIHSTVFATLLASQTDPDARARALARGEPTGAIVRWRAGRVDTLRLPFVSGANGLLVSPDAHFLFVAMTGTREVVRYDLAGDSRAVRLPVDFNPDNLRWTANGLISVAGMHVPFATYIACVRKPVRTDYCASEWEVDFIDPRTMKIVSKKAGDLPGYGDVTTGLQVGDDLWLTSLGPEDKIAIIPNPDFKVAKGRRPNQAH